MSRDLDIKLLRAFEAVVRAGGVSRAAELLNRSQPVVSHQIRKLEDMVGHPLFVSERSWEMTAKGEKFLAAARRILAINDQAFSDLGKPCAPDALKLGVPEEFAAHCLTHAMEKFTARWPSVPIDIEVGLSRNLLRQLHDGRLDLILAKQPRLRPSESESVWDENLIWVAGQGFKPTPGEPVPLVVFGDDCLYRRSAIQSLSDADRSWRIAATCPSWTTIRAYVAAGVGYTITSRRFPLHGLREVANDEGLPALPYVTVLLMRGPRSHTEAGNCLSTILREAAQAPVIH